MLFRKPHPNDRYVSSFQLQISFALAMTRRTLISLVACAGICVLIGVAGSVPIAEEHSASENAFNREVSSDETAESK